MSVPRIPMRPPLFFLPLVRIINDLIQNRRKGVYCGDTATHRGSFFKLITIVDLEVKYSTDILRRSNNDSQKMVKM